MFCNRPNRHWLPGIEAKGLLTPTRFGSPTAIKKYRESAALDNHMKERGPARAAPRPENPLSWLPLLLITSISLVLWATTSFVVLLPAVVPSLLEVARRERTPPSALTLTVGITMFSIFQLIFLLLVISAARTVFTAPGHIPAWLRSDGKSDLHSYSNLLQAVERKRDGSPRFCRKTGAYKPDRAHYCKEVKDCVLCYQTFSTCLNSAVGYYNYKYYLLTLFYASLNAAWVIAATVPEAILLGQNGGFTAKQMTELRRLAVGDRVVAESQGMLDAAGPWTRMVAWAVVNTQQQGSTHEAQQWVVDAVIVITMGLAGLCLVPCLYMIGLHLWLIVHGRTEYEWRTIRRGRRPDTRSLFDYGYVNNFALTLGNYPLAWLIPTRHGIIGNGIFFAEQDRLGMH